MIDLPPAPLRFPEAMPASDHARLAESERDDEHANRVQRDQCGDAPPERDDQDERDRGQRDDPRVERQAFAAELEDARQEAVARQELDRRRKSAKDVFAANTSKTAVEIWMSRWNGVPRPTNALVIWLITVTCSVGSGTIPS